MSIFSIFVDIMSTTRHRDLKPDIRKLSVLNYILLHLRYCQPITSPCILDYRKNSTLNVMVSYYGTESFLLLGWYFNLCLCLLVVARDAYMLNVYWNECQFCIVDHYLMNMKNLSIVFSRESVHGRLSWEESKVRNGRNCEFDLINSWNQANFWSGRIREYGWLPGRLRIFAVLSRTFQRLLVLITKIRCRTLSEL